MPLPTNSSPNSDPLSFPSRDNSLLQRTQYTHLLWLPNAKNRTPQRRHTSCAALAVSLLLTSVPCCPSCLFCWPGDRFLLLLECLFLTCFFIPLTLWNTLLQNWHFQGETFAHSDHDCVLWVTLLLLVSMKSFSSILLPWRDASDFLHLECFFLTCFCMSLTLWQTLLQNWHFQGETVAHSDHDCVLWVTLLLLVSMKFCSSSLHPWWDASDFLHLECFFLTCFCMSPTLWQTLPQNLHFQGALFTHSDQDCALWHTLLLVVSMPPFSSGLHSWWEASAFLLLECFFLTCFIMPLTLWNTLLQNSHFQGAIVSASEHAWVLSATLLLVASIPFLSSFLHPCWSSDLFLLGCLFLTCFFIVLSFWNTLLQFGHFQSPTLLSSLWYFRMCLYRPFDVMNRLSQCRQQIGGTVNASHFAGPVSVDEEHFSSSFIESCFKRCLRRPWTVRNPSPQRWHLYGRSCWLFLCRSKLCFNENPLRQKGHAKAVFIPACERLCWDKDRLDRNDSQQTLQTWGSCAFASTTCLGNVTCIFPNQKWWLLCDLNESLEMNFFAQISHLKCLSSVWNFEALGNGIGGDKWLDWQAFRAWWVMWEHKDVCLWKDLLQILQWTAELLTRFTEDQEELGAFSAW